MHDPNRPSEPLTEIDVFRRFGLRPPPEALPEVRRMLRAQVALESAAQGDGDTQVMRLLCMILFFAGQVEDAVLILQAKQASMDAAISIDVHMALGAGPEITQRFLAQNARTIRPGILAQVDLHIAAGDHLDINPTEWERYFDNA